MTSSPSYPLQHYQPQVPIIAQLSAPQLFNAIEIIDDEAEWEGRKRSIGFGWLVARSGAS